MLSYKLDFSCCANKDSLCKSLVSTGVVTYFYSYVHTFFAEIAINSYANIAMLNSNIIIFIC